MDPWTAITQNIPASFGKGDTYQDSILLTGLLEQALSQSTIIRDANGEKGFHSKIAPAVKGWIEVNGSPDPINEMEALAFAFAGLSIKEPWEAWKSRSGLPSSTNDPVWSRVDNALNKASSLIAERSKAYERSLVQDSTMPQNLPAERVPMANVKVEEIPVAIQELKAVVKALGLNENNVVLAKLGQQSKAFRQGGYGLIITGFRTVTPPNDSTAFIGQDVFDVSLDELAAEVDGSRNDMNVLVSLNSNTPDEVAFFNDWVKNASFDANIVIDTKNAPVGVKTEPKEESPLPVYFPATDAQTVSIPPAALPPPLSGMVPNESGSTSTSPQQGSETTNDSAATDSAQQSTDDSASLLDQFETFYAGVVDDKGKLKKPSAKDSIAWFNRNVNSKFKFDSDKPGRVLPIIRSYLSKLAGKENVDVLAKDLDQSTIPDLTALFKAFGLTYVEKDGKRSVGKDENISNAKNQTLKMPPIIKEDKSSSGYPFDYLSAEYDSSDDDDDDDAPPSIF
ncbi:MAG: hypothetical protein AB7P49_00075 [Bdellovibrionales bacterium]